MNKFAGTCLAEQIGTQIAEDRQFDVMPAFYGETGQFGQYAAGQPRQKAFQRYVVFVQFMKWRGGGDFLTSCVGYSVFMLTTGRYVPALAGRPGDFAALRTLTV